MAKPLPVDRSRKKPAGGFLPVQAGRWKFAFELDWKGIRNFISRRTGSEFPVASKTRIPPHGNIRDDLYRAAGRMNR
jgi:hypothetical protein